MKHLTMASRSLKSKLNKRANSKSNIIASSSSSSLSPDMDSSKLYRFNYLKSSALFLFIFVILVVVLGVSSNTRSKFLSVDHSPKFYSIDVVNVFPHDPNAFTQGLLYFGNNTLYESTGLYGSSSVRKVALRTGKVEISKRMDYSDFGEGLTLLGDRLFQVTWLKNTGFIYDRKNLSKLRKFTHEMKDGWGLATDGKILFGSDGTSTLYKIDPKTLKVMDKHIVKYKGRAVPKLNELEFINGEVWANIWQTDCIARISHEDGRVLGWILMPQLREGLVTSGHTGIDVLNGIAWDGERERLFVTGKLWPKLYEIKLRPMKKELDDALVGRLCIVD